MEYDSSKEGHDDLFSFSGCSRDEELGAALVKEYKGTALTGPITRMHHSIQSYSSQYEEDDRKEGAVQLQLQQGEQPQLQRGRAQQLWGRARNKLLWLPKDK